MNETKTILLVDDDADFLEQTSLILGAAGYRLVTASSQAEADEALLATVPDLCVFDLMMETTDAGFVLCHTAKRLYPGVPVILLTAARACTGMELGSRTRTAAAWIEADAFLDKPVRAEQLRAEVGRLLGASSQA